MSGMKFLPEAMGENDPRIVYFVNFVPDPNNLSPDQRDMLVNLQDAVKLTEQSVYLRATIDVDSRMKSGQLPSSTSMADRLKRVAHRIQAMHFIFNSISWAPKFSEKVASKDYRESKSEFHQALLKDFLDGMDIPKDVRNSADAVLRTASDEILKTRFEQVDQMFLGVVTFYQWDATIQDFRAQMRTLRMKINDSFKQYIASKDSVSDVNLRLQYQKCDYIFNRQLFEGSARTGIQNMIRNSGVPVNLNAIDLTY